MLNEDLQMNKSMNTVFFCNEQRIQAQPINQYLSTKLQVLGCAQAKGRMAEKLVLKSMLSGARGLISAQSASCVTLGKLLNLSWFSHLPNDDNNSNYLIWLTQGLNKEIHSALLEQRIVRRK